MAEDTQDGPAEIAAPPKKKSLFSKSPWAKPVAQKEGIEFFSRADELWPERLAEEERKRQRKALKLERKRSSTSVELKQSSTPENKRQRSSQNEAERHSSEGPLQEDPEESNCTREESTLSTPYNSKSKSGSPTKPQISPVSLVARYSRDLKTKSKKPPSMLSGRREYISVSDSEDEADRGISPNQYRPVNLDDEDDDDDIVIISNPPIQLEEDPNLSDEEFPELARQARERAKRKELERVKAGESFQNKNHNIPISKRVPIHLDNDVFEDVPVIVEDPIVEIFVSSVIENTIPLLVKRTLSQNLHKVKLAWCDKQSISGQPFDKSTTESIFLTWKGIKLYDFTTCKSLGLKLDGNGHVKAESEGFNQGKIHFEAWTQDLYDSSQRRLKAKQDAGSDEEVEVVEQPVEPRMKLILQAKGMKPFNIKVKATTTISKMEWAFRDGRDIPEGQEITLHFDGDRLDPDSVVGDLDLDDLDCIEVHIR